MSCHELQIAWDRDFGVDLGYDFVDLDVFQSFIESKYTGAKTSERFFQIFLCHILESLNCQPTITRHHPLNIMLDAEREIEKRCRIDLRIDMNATTIFIELKKNIDLIEKDLFKWFLITKEPSVQRHHKLQIIWEREDRSRDKRSGKPNQYQQLLKYAVLNGWIDDYFYLTYDTFDDTVRKLRDFFQTHMGT
jgi:hypothetical protein